MKITVIGGGNVGTLISAQFSNKGHQVTLYTRDKTNWRDELIVSDNDESYGAKMATEEITFIKEIRKYDKLYEQMIADPRRFVELINIKLK